MEANERAIFSDDWITLTFIVGIILLFLMKLYKPQRLLGYAVAFFTQGFIEKRAEENPSIFSPFHSFMFLFSIITISLALYMLLTAQGFDKNFFVFAMILGGTALYFILKVGINQLIANLLSIEEETRYFLFAKNGYLYSLCLWLFPVLILYQFTIKNTAVLLTIISLFLIFRGLLILRNNKKLLFNQLFYFILYFCTVELAPLLILYKTITI